MSHFFIELWPPPPDGAGAAGGVAGEPAGGAGAGVSGAGAGAGASGGVCVGGDCGSIRIKSLSYLYAYCIIYAKWNIIKPPKTRQ